jgi:K+-sensing histidine kinase KdpD
VPLDAAAGLLRAVGHDLRSPLTLVTGVLQTLTRPDVVPDDPEVGRLIHSAIGGSRRMCRSLDDFAEAADLISGELELHARTIDPAGVLDQAIGADERLAARATVRATASVPTVVADPGRLSRIVTGLAHGELRRGATRLTVDVAVGAERLVVVLVGDGPPLSAEAVAAWAHDPWAAEGLGLSERLAGGLARAMGGRLSPLPLGSAGTGYRLVLPRTPDTQPGT